MSEPIKLPEAETEATIKSLQQKVAKQKVQLIEMDYQIGAVQDMSRVQITADICAGLASHSGRVLRSDVSEAMDIAELIMDRYNDIVTERKAQYSEAIEKLEMEAATKKATGTEQ